MVCLFIGGLFIYHIFCSRNVYGSSQHDILPELIPVRDILDVAAALKVAPLSTTIDGTETDYVLTGEKNSS